jgi:hypothetical protein
MLIVAYGCSKTTYTNWVQQGGGFSSEHTTGDLFITMAFTGGGGHPERHVYKWIVPTGLVEVTLSTAAADVASNQSSVYPAPTRTWSFVSKDTAAANVYPRNGFLEGFVDIDSLGFGVDICSRNSSLTPGPLHQHLQY